MPERQWSYGNQYRYGFNGKENDNEVKGTGSQQDYGLRIYDPRTGRFLSVDPLASKFPFYSPFQFAGNSPVANIDLDGAEPTKPGNHIGQTETGTTNGEADARSWTWNGANWEEAQMSEVVISTYSINYRKPLAPIVEKMYEKDMDDIRKRMVEDLANHLFKPPSIGTGLPDAKSLTENLLKSVYGEEDGGKLFGTISTIVENRDDPMGMIASTLGPAGSLFYENILKGMFLNPQIREYNLHFLRNLDAFAKNDINLFNSRFPNTRSFINNGKLDQLGIITVTRKQFCDIMNNKFFEPSKFQSTLIFSPSQQQSIANTPYFNGEKPMYYIYFNMLSNKGFLHVSEIGVTPIFPVIKQAEK